jgi:hypothetical protein
MSWLEHRSSRARAEPRQACCSHGRVRVRVRARARVRDRVRVRDRDRDRVRCRPAAHTARLGLG